MDWFVCCLGDWCAIALDYSAMRPRPFPLIRPSCWPP